MRARYAPTSPVDVIVPTESAACNCGIVASISSNGLVWALEFDTGLMQSTGNAQAMADVTQLITLRKMFIGASFEVKVIPQIQTEQPVEFADGYAQGCS